MSDNDKILNEMHIQIDTYRHENNGESPTLVVSGKFYESLLFESISLYNIKVNHDGTYTILGCKCRVFYRLEFDEFIIGKGFKVTI